MCDILNLSILQKKVEVNAAVVSAHFIHASAFFRSLDKNYSTQKLKLDPLYINVGLSGRAKRVDCDKTKKFQI